MAVSTVDQELYTKRQAVAARLVEVFKLFCKGGALERDCIADPVKADIIKDIKSLVPLLSPNKPLYASFHDGQVHDPLGAGSYAYEKDFEGPLLRTLVDDEEFIKLGIEMHVVSAGGTSFASSASAPLMGERNERSKHERPKLALDGEVQVTTLLDGVLSLSSPSDVELPYSPTSISLDMVGSHSHSETNGQEHALDGTHDGLPAAATSNDVALPTLPIVIHAGAQPNNSPHGGTILVFCTAFRLAQRLSGRMADIQAHNPSIEVPKVKVHITLVDTAPVKDESVTRDGVDYQKSYRQVPGALATHMDDYQEIFDLLHKWTGIPFTVSHQSDFFAQPIMPSLVRYLIDNHERLGRQLSPKYGEIAIRAACPEEGCGLAEKHGRMNVYDSSKITFTCPDHGHFTVSLSSAQDIARLEANAPTRNLLRSLAHLFDTSTHHIRVTGSDYSGTYQEQMLYRPLAEWGDHWGHPVAGRVPHIVYTPLITDWSGAKLSKSLYVKDGGYEVMKLLGSEGLCSYAKLKEQYNERGLKKLWKEVGTWFANPKKLFRQYSVEYLMTVLEAEDFDD